MTDKKPDPAAIALLQAARSIQQCIHPIISTIPLADLVQDLQASLDAAPETAADLHAQLATQARVLDSVFNRLIEHGARKDWFNPATIATALKAQKQYRDTVGTLDKTDRAAKKAHKKAAQTDYWIPDNANPHKK